MCYKVSHPASVCVSFQGMNIDINSFKTLNSFITKWKTSHTFNRDNSDRYVPLSVLSSFVKVKWYSCFCPFFSFVSSFSSLNSQYTKVSLSVFLSASIQTNFSSPSLCFSLLFTFILSFSLSNLSTIMCFHQGHA